VRPHRERSRRSARSVSDEYFDVMKRLLLVSALLLAGCGSARVAEQLPARHPNPALVRQQLALRQVRADFGARWIPNAWGVGKPDIRIRGYTLEAWSALPTTRASREAALDLCTRMYRRYVIALYAHYGVGQAAVYSRQGVLLTASLRYKGRCYWLR
jgi:hypothetical protein